MRLVLLVGLPASGKSTWIRQHGVFALSSDEVREMVTGDVTNQSMNRLVFQTMRQLAAARARAGADATYIDSTALTLWERRCWIRFAELNDCTVEALFFDVPLAECKRRNAARARVVPEEVMDRMAARLVPPSPDEGFTRVSTVAGSPTTATPDPPREFR